MSHMNSLYMRCCSDKSGTNHQSLCKLREITMKEKQRKIRKSVRTEEGVCMYMFSCFHDQTHTRIYLRYDSPSLSHSCASDILTSNCFHSGSYRCRVQFTKRDEYFIGFCSSSPPNAIQSLAFQSL